jgi:hypothetical protein
MPTDHTGDFTEFTTEFTPQNVTCAPANGSAVGVRCAGEAELEGAGGLSRSGGEVEADSRSVGCASGCERGGGGEGGGRGGEEGEGGAVYLHRSVLAFFEVRREELLASSNFSQLQRVLGTPLQADILEGGGGEGGECGGGGGEGGGCGGEVAPSSIPQCLSRALALQGVCV